LRRGIHHVWKGSETPTKFWSEHRHSEDLGGDGKVIPFTMDF